MCYNFLKIENFTLTVISFLYPNFHLLRACLIFISNGSVTLNVGKYDLLTGQELSEQNLPIDQPKTLFIRWLKHHSLYSKCIIVISVTVQWISHMTRWLGDFSQALSSWMKPEAPFHWTTLIQTVLQYYTSHDKLDCDGHWTNFESDGK